MKNEIKYKTAGGNTVTWRRAPDDSRDDPWGSYECGGCGKTDRAYLSCAAGHALRCRAL